MTEHMPEEAKRLEREGRMDSYLDDVQRRWLELKSRLETQYMQEMGVTQELHERNIVEWMSRLDQAVQRATEEANRQVIEAH